MVIDHLATKERRQLASYLWHGPSTVARQVMDAPGQGSALLQVGDARRLRYVAHVYEITPATARATAQCWLRSMSTMARSGGGT